MTDSGFTSDSVGGHQLGSNTGAAPFSDDSKTNSSTGVEGVSGTRDGAYGNNVEQTYGEAEGKPKKEGFMSKMKDKLMPDGPGETPKGGDGAAAAGLAAQGGPTKHGNPGADLNRE